jgi:Epoxide hydrolase N terminus
MTCISACSAPDGRPSSRSTPSPGEYGFGADRLQRLVARWLEFDWRSWEKRLNASPQYRTEIDGQPVHFLHVRSAEPGALPVALSYVTQLLSFPGGDPAELADLSADEQTGLEVLGWFWQPKGRVQHPAQSAATDSRPCDQRLAGRLAGLERPTFRRVAGRRLRSGQRLALLAHRHRRHVYPALLRGRPRTRCGSRRADDRADRARGRGRR